MRVKYFLKGLFYSFIGHPYVALEYFDLAGLKFTQKINSRRIKNLKVESQFSQGRVKIKGIHLAQVIIGFLLLLQAALSPFFGATISEWGFLIRLGLGVGMVIIGGEFLIGEKK